VARRIFEMQQSNFEIAAGAAMAEAKDVIKLEQAQMRTQFDQQTSGQQEEHRRSLNLALNTLTQERAAANDAQRACYEAKEHYVSELKQQYVTLSGAAADAVASTRDDVTKQATELLGQRDTTIATLHSELTALRQIEYNLRIEFENTSSQQNSSIAQVKQQCAHYENVAREQSAQCNQVRAELSQSGSAADSVYAKLLACEQLLLSEKDNFSKQKEMNVVLYKQLKEREQAHLVALSQRDAMIVAPKAGGSAPAPPLPTADPAIAAAQIKSWSDRAGKAEQSVTALNKRCADLEETCATLAKDKQEIQLDLDQLKEQYASYEDAEGYLECSESEAAVSDTAETEQDESDDEQPNSARIDPHLLFSPVSRHRELSFTI